MAIQLTCECGRKLRIGEEHAGGQGRCPMCGRILDIPGGDAPPAWPGSTVLEPEVRMPSLTPVTFDSSEPLPSYASAPAPPPRPREGRLSQWGGRALAVALGLIGLIVVLLIVAGRSGMFTASLGTRLAVTAEEEVYYKDVSLEQARLLGEALKELGYFDGKGRKTVQLTRKDGRYVFSLVILKEFRADAKAIAGLRLLGRQLSGLVFNDEPVEVRMCDEHLSVQRSLEPGESLGKRATFGKKEELYYRGITAEEARQIGAVLQEDGYFSGAGDATAAVMRVNDSYRISFMVSPESWEDPDTCSAFEERGRRLSQKVLHNRPVAVQLCDEGLVVKKSLP